MPANKSCCSAADRGCCEKSSKLLKIDVDFLAASSQVMARIIIDSPADIDIAFYSLPGSNVSLKSVMVNHGPPGLPVDLLLLTQSFRI